MSLLLVAVDYKFALGHILGYSFHRYCDNDWDIMGTNNAEGRMVNELPGLGHFMYGISSAYGSIFRKTHRKIISHAPFISTAIRLVFILFVPFMIGDSWGINFIGDGWWKFWLGFYIGLSHADALHYYLDLTYGD